MQHLRFLKLKTYPYFVPYPSVHLQHIKYGIIRNLFQLGPTDGWKNMAEIQTWRNG